jgi:hypothetical protein
LNNHDHTTADCASRRNIVFNSVMTRFTGRRADQAARRAQPSRGRTAQGKPRLAPPGGRANSRVAWGKRLVA